MQLFFEHLITRLWYRSKLFGQCLSPLSALFGILICLRYKAYRWGIFTSYRSVATIIVVGNISVGGTGKTPLVIALIHFLLQHNRAVVVISRGFGRVNRQLIVVNDACQAKDCGDEPLLIFQCTRVPVIVARTRLAAVKYAEQHYPGALIISDDGLQHYALARDIEIAVLDGQRGCGNGHLLPGGPLREPLSRLKYVDYTVLNGGPYAYPGAYAMDLQAQQVRQLSTHHVVAFEKLATMGQWLALTAIGNPERFFVTLQSLGLNFDKHCFPDHYLFQREDLAIFKDRLLLVTAKDAVKLHAFGFDNIYVLDVAALLPERFYQQLLEHL